MDDHIVDLIRDQFKAASEHSNTRFDSVEEKLTAMTTALSAHVEKDETYWKQIDGQQAQFRLIKGLFGGGAFVAAVTWIYERFVH